MNRMMKFSTANPTGNQPGMEPVRLDVIKAAVNNELPGVPHIQPAATVTPAPTRTPPLVNKNVRLPADLVEFIDYTYTKDQRMKKQDAYTHALETFFRPLMQAKA